VRPVLDPVQQRFDCFVPSLYALIMQEINVSDFRAKCLTLFEELPADGIVVTKHGRPVATVTPVSSSNGDPIGSLPGLVLDPGDDLFSTGIVWNAQS
jgi:prevent-host-death family protein